MPKVNANNIQIEYDTGPGSAVYANCQPPVGAVELGHRIIVRVVVTYEPLLSVGIEPFQITSEAKRTIVKEVELN